MTKARRIVNLKISAVLLLLPIFVSLEDVHARQSKPYRGAEYRTKVSYLYGRFEVRMKSAGGSGMLTSFFTYYDGFPFSSANWNEIDIEILGRYNNEVQTNTITAYETSHEKRNVVWFNPHQAFHIYAFEWTPDYVAWLVDGYEVFRDTREHVPTLNREQKIMMNIWPPNYVDWTGVLDPTRLPIYGYYDWIRYYSYTPGVGDNFTLQWTDELNSWDQTQWDKGTHTWDGNNSQFIPENAVFQNGYMILCLTTPTATGYNGNMVVDLDVDPPSVVWAHAEEAGIDVYFSEAIETSSAETTSNYIIPGIKVVSATLQPDFKVVRLTTEGYDLAQSSVLVVTNVSDRSPSAHKMSLKQTRISNGLILPALFNVGGSASSAALADSTWDFYKEYGATGGASQAISAGTVATASDHAEIYESASAGLAFYRVRLPAGRYDLTFMLAETEKNSAGQRIFDIVAEGSTVIDDLDIFAEAGKNTALEKNVNDLSVTDGVLDLYFKAEKGVPVLSGLKIVQRATTSIDESRSVPDQFGLRVFPNPFNPSTNLTYSLRNGGHVRLALYSSNGQLLKSLVDDYRSAGEHRYALSGQKLTTGIYFVQMLVDGQAVESQKLAFLK